MEVKLTSNVLLLEKRIVKKIVVCSPRNWTSAAEVSLENILSSQLESEKDKVDIRTAIGKALPKVDHIGVETIHIRQKFPHRCKMIAQDFESCRIFYPNPYSLSDILFYPIILLFDVNYLN